MNRQTILILASALGIVGVLFFVATGFQIIPRNYALFLGVACCILSGWLYAIRGRLNRS